MKNYNVLDEQWMPVTTLNNDVIYISPLELFSNLNQYVGFAGDPTENYCMLRFVCALAQSSKKSQPVEFGQLKALKSTYAINAIEYINENIDLFWLRGENPFLLCNESDIGLDSKGKEIKLAQLQLREIHAAGNNPLLFNMSQSSYQSLHDIPLDLLVRHTYSVGYGSVSKLPTRTCIWGKGLKGIINVYVSGETLYDSIWLNMHYGNDFGIPVWESRFDNSYSTTYLNRLVTLGSKIFISDDLTSMKCNIGIQYPDIETTAFMALTSTKTEKIPVMYTLNSRIWKEYSTILSSNNDRPDQLKGNRMATQNNITVNTIASYFNTNSGYFYTQLFSTSINQLLNAPKLNTDDYPKFYSKCVDLCDLVVNDIKKSFFGVRGGILYPNTTKRNTTESNIISNECALIIEHFWQYIDNESQFLFQCDGTNNDLSKWKSIILSALQSMIALIQKKYGFITSYKFESTKLIFKLKSKTLNTKEN